MAVYVIMPRQGQSVESCIITRWFKNKGEKVKSGDILFSYETDKAAFDLESPADGTLLEVFYNEGDEVPVLVNVAVIGSEDEKISAEAAPQSAVEKVTPYNESVQASPAAVKPREPAESAGTERIRISPRAKKYAAAKGVDFSKLKGSGPGGRIMCADIEKAITIAGSVAPTSSFTVDYTDQPLSNVRRIISKAMHSSLQNSAQLTHHMSADARGLLEARKKIKTALSAGSPVNDITLNDMICWCVIRALQKFPEANCHFLDDRIRVFKNVHLGVAVDTPRGLMVPSLRNADGMDIKTLSVSLKSLADSCRKGNIDPQLIQSTSASFTVTNLGNYGVEMFTPVINLPQVAILGVCTITYRPADLGNNVFGFIPYIGLSLTYDHRAIDGGPATLFLREIKEQIEGFRMSD
ncbi:MAG: 2-oxo acid dehydrogenase subunit E2 [Bacteroidales bacterium]|nr:2-oxo acid dehydrogenase subunit E2 [Bacteroidales bacterium]